MVYQTQTTSTELKIHWTTSYSDETKGTNGSADNMIIHERVTESIIHGNIEEDGKHSYWIDEQSSDHSDLDTNKHIFGACIDRTRTIVAYRKCEEFPSRWILPRIIGKTSEGLINPIHYQIRSTLEWNPTPKNCIESINLL